LAIDEHLTHRGKWRSNEISDFIKRRCLLEKQKELTHGLISENDPDLNFVITVAHNRTIPNEIRRPEADANANLLRPAGEMVVSAEFYLYLLR
jgi:hypothetical protein